MSGFRRGRRTEEEIPSPFLKSRSVKTLVRTNFNQVLNVRDTAALVMFYTPECIFCQSAKPHFLKAAKSTHSRTHFYGAVDCSREEHLCEMENIRSFPTFKLYIAGRFLAKYTQSPHYDNIKKFLENAPLDTIVEPQH